MTARDDFPGEMEAFPNDSTTAEAVFGASGAHAAPEELRDIAELVAAARRTGSADELVGEDAIVARIAAAMGEHAAPPQGGTHERIAVLKNFRTAKVTAAATAVLLLGGTAAAAATGSLPTPVTHHHLAEPAAAHTVAAPRHHEQHAPATPSVSGAVASVNGVADPGTCGVSGAAGSLTLTTHHGQTLTVNVATTTTFTEKGVASPSFANVCVGSKVWAKGAIGGLIVTAEKIAIKPPRTKASGRVASVNGVTTAGTCGVAGTAGTFALTARKHQVFTVNVGTTTAYVEQGVASPTFANVCVASLVKVQGAFVDTTVAANTVTIKLIAPKHDDGEHAKHDKLHHDGHKLGAFGTVASVNGVTTDGTCGAAGAAGTFMVTGFKGTIFTVNVTGTTNFKVPGVTDPTFANVCVGGKVAAKGDTAETTVAATDVFVLPAHLEGDHDGDHHGDKHRAKHHGSGRHGHKGNRDGKHRANHDS